MLLAFFLVFVAVSGNVYPYDDVRDFLPASFLASQGIRLPKPIHRQETVEKRHIQSYSPREEDRNTPYIGFHQNIHSGYNQPPVRQLTGYRQQRPVYNPYRQQIITQYGQTGAQYPRNGVLINPQELHAQRPLVRDYETIYEEVSDSSEDTTGHNDSEETSQETETVESTEHPYEHLLKGDFKLSDLSMDQLGVFLEDEKSVTQLSDCFMDVEDCPSASAVRLIKQIQSLGMGGKCEECTEEEQEKVEDLVYSFIAKFSEKYPLLWFRMLPRLGYLMVSSRF